MNVIEYLKEVGAPSINPSRVSSKDIYKWLKGKTVTPFRNKNGHNYELEVPFIFGSNNSGTPNHSSNINLSSTSNAYNMSALNVKAKVRGNNIRYSDLRIIISDSYDSIIHRSMKHVNERGDVKNGITEYKALAKLMLEYSKFEITSLEVLAYMDVVKKIGKANIGINRFNLRLKALGLETWQK